MVSTGGPTHVYLPSSASSNTVGGGTYHPSSLALAAAQPDDSLTVYLLKREKKALNYILTGAKLLAPALNPVSAGQLLRELVSRYAC